MAVRGEGGGAPFLSAATRGVGVWRRSVVQRSAAPKTRLASKPGQGRGSRGGDGRVKTGVMMLQMGSMTEVVGWSWVVRVEQDVLWVAVPGIGLLRVPAEMDYLRGPECNLTYVYSLNSPVAVAIHDGKAIGICKPWELHQAEARFVSSEGDVGEASTLGGKIRFKLGQVASEIRLPPLPVSACFSSFREAGLYRGVALRFAGIQTGPTRVGHGRSWRAVTLAPPAELCPSALPLPGNDTFSLASAAAAHLMPIAMYQPYLYTHIAYASLALAACASPAKSSSCPSAPSFLPSNGPPQPLLNLPFAQCQIMESSSVAGQTRGLPVKAKTMAKSTKHQARKRRQKRRRTKLTLTGTDQDVAISPPPQPHNSDQHVEEHVGEPSELKEAS